MQFVKRRFIVVSVSAALLGAPDARAQWRRPAAATDSLRRLPAVVVTATRDSISPLASPLPTSGLGHDELRRDHGVSLSQTLARLPGVRSLSTGEQVGKPVIRGLGGARVLVLDDGLRLEDYSFSDEDGPSIDARLADRVEVIRGPASVLYGSDALGGVVNVLPAALLDAHGGASLRRGQAEVYGASNNGEVGTTLGIEAARGRVGARALFVGRFGRNVRTPAATIPNTGYVAANGEVAVGVHHRDGVESTIRFAHYGGEFQLLETDAPPAGGSRADAGGPARVTLDDRIQLSHRRPAGAMTVELRSQFQRHGLAERADNPAPGPGQPREATVFDLLLSTVTADLLLHHGAADERTEMAPVPRVQGTIGLSTQGQQNESRGVVPLVPDATSGTAGVFAFERVSFGRLALLGGVRGDARHQSVDASALLALPAQSRTFRAFTWDVGAVYRLVPTVSLSANAGRAWRAPTLAELYANGPRLGEGRYEYGDPGLTPERSVNLDASLRWEAPRVRAELSGFRTRVDHFLYIAPTHAVQNNLRVYRYRQGDAQLVGGEASAAVIASDALTLRTRVDGVRGTLESEDDPLPLMPPLRGAVGAEVRSAIMRQRGAYVAFDVERVARSSRLSQEEASSEVEPGHFPLATPAYTEVDLAAGLALALRGRPSQLDLKVRNAANRPYRDFLDRYKEFAYAPGVNVVLRLSTAF